MRAAFQSKAVVLWSDFGATLVRETGWGTDNFVELLDSNREKSQVAAAKEVGMGNPAEKNDRSPDKSILGDHLPLLARVF